MSESNNKLTLIVLGRSGSGKGTQARFIDKRLERAGGIHVSTGELLRSFMHRTGPAAEIARRVMRQGGLHPSWLAAYLWLGVIIDEGGGTRHLVFDGACRRLFEAKLLDEVMRWHGRPLPFCISKEVVPVLRYYQKSGRMISVDGEQPPERVFAEIDRALRKKIGKRWPRR